MEQIVDVPGSSGRGGRISERIVEQTIDVPGLRGERLQALQPPRWEAAESPNQEVFRTFPKRKKCDK